MLGEENLGLIGGIIGGVIGLAGGVFGTWMSIRSTTLGEQRKFIIKASIFTWIGILVFLTVLFTIPNPWGSLIWIVYTPALVLSILYTNRKLQSMRVHHNSSSS